MMTSTPSPEARLSTESRQELQIAQKSTEAALVAALSIDMRRLPRSVREHVRSARSALRNANDDLKVVLEQS